VHAAEGAAVTTVSTSAPAGAAGRDDEATPTAPRAPADTPAALLAPLEMMPPAPAAPLAARGGFGLSLGGGPPRGTPPPHHAPPPQAAPRAAATPDKSVARDQVLDARPAIPSEIEPDERLMRFGSLRLPPPGKSSGTLRIETPEALYVELSQTLESEAATSLAAILRTVGHAAGRALRRPLPRGYVAPDPAPGFDALYEAHGVADVPSDGEPHVIPVLSSEAPCAIRHVAVPRETSEVFRLAEITSRLEAPLLPGPCDVYLGDAYFLAIDLPAVAPRGALSVGLGVDQAVKIARNVSFTGQSTGLMGGALALKHQIRIEVESHAAESIDLEVRERVPVAAEDEEDVKVEIGEVKPAWRTWEPPPIEAPLRGGYAWRVRLDPRQRAELSASYAVRIPSKLELVGGNRRD
jgi:hypothetical protein